MLNLGNLSEFHTGVRLAAVSNLLFQLVGADMYGVFVRVIYTPTFPHQAHAVSDWYADRILLSSLQGCPKVC